MHNTRLSKLILAVLGGFLFALAYTQSPLYTSNQNQYFLHGLASAGFGYLDRDWLANTLDPTPVFSGLVYLTIRLTGLPQLFYGYYAFLLGIYLYCLVGIFDLLYNIRQSFTRLVVFLALIFLVHSAGLRFFLSVTLGENWTYLLEDGLASQRLLGPVFQPSVFGVLLVVSIYLFLRNKPIPAVLLAALAATIHPTYLLGAGALTIAYMIVLYIEKQQIKGPVQVGVIALLAVTPILIYVYTSFADTPPETTARAQDILVNFRIPFHAAASRWFDLTAVVKLAIIISALYLLRETRLFLVLFVPFMIGVMLTITQLATQSNALALLFPWRISTFLMPIATTTLLAIVVTRLFSRWPDLEQKSLLIWISASLILFVVLVGLIRLKLDFQRQAYAPEHGALNYAAAHAGLDQYYMTPLDLQDFRLATGLPVYVEFKSIPYRDRDVIEWERRIRTTDLFYKQADCAWLEKLARLGVTHVIATPKLFNLGCQEWSVLYRDRYYGVYRLR